MTRDPALCRVACICDRTRRAGRCSPLIEDTTMRVTLLPADAHNQRTITQGHPPTWQNPPGGDYDLVVLGGGPAGLIAATTAAAGGHRVAMTEQRLTGGTCVNFGCTPSKALIRCARAVHDAGRGAEFGFRLDAPPQADFGLVMQRLRSLSSAGDAVEVAEQAGGGGLPRAHALHRAECRGGRGPADAISEGRDRHRIGPPWCPPSRDCGQAST